MAGVSNQLIGGVMAFVMGIVQMVRITKNMPRKLTEAALYGSQALYADAMMNGRALPAPTISTAEYKAIMTRMAEMEEKLNVLLSKPEVMPPEKEAMLNATTRRVEALEEELATTKKVLQDTLAKQQELLADAQSLSRVRRDLVHHRNLRRRNAEPAIIPS